MGARGGGDERRTRGVAWPVRRALDVEETVDAVMKADRIAMLVRGSDGCRRRCFTTYMRTDITPYIIHIETHTHTTPHASPGKAGR